MIRGGLQRSARPGHLAWLWLALLGSVLAGTAAWARTVRPTRSYPRPSTASDEGGQPDPRIDDAVTTTRPTSAGEPREASAKAEALGKAVPRRVQLFWGRDGVQVRAVATVRDPALAARADVDTNGSIDPSEAAPLAAMLGAQAFAHTTIVWDTQLLRFDEGCRLDGTPTPAPLDSSFQITVSRSLADTPGTAPRRFVFHDRPGNDDEIVPLAIHTEPGWTLEHVVAGRAESRGAARWELVLWRTAPVAWGTISPPSPATSPAAISAP